MIERQTVTAKGGAEATVRRLLLADGTGVHAHVTALTAPRIDARGLSDAVHAFGAVHGHHPDLLSIAAHAATGPARAWLGEAAAAFAVERAGLAQLVAAAGPLPSTPGQGETAAALGTTRHAIEMLARSERVGVAIGASVALVADWHDVRTVIARAAERFGVELASAVAPPIDAIIGAVPERALAFGAQQLLAQHRGLWDLLEARAGARAAH